MTNGGEMSYKMELTEKEVRVIGEERWEKRHPNIGFICFLWVFTSLSCALVPVEWHTVLKIIASIIISLIALTPLALFMTKRVKAGVHFLSQIKREQGDERGV